MRVTRTILFLLLLCNSVWAQNSLYLSSSIQWVNCGDLDVTGNQLTVEALIHMTGPSVDIVSKHTDPSNVNYLLRPGGFEITTTSGYTSVGNSVPLLQNVTYHVAATYDGATVRYYVNGCETGSTPWSGNMVTSNLLTAIGQQSQCQCEQFIGYIDEVRIWNVARTAAELQANMNALLSPTTQPGLLAYYQLDGNAINIQGDPTWNGTEQGAAGYSPMPGPFPSPLAVTTLSTNISCNGSADGSVTINATGGIAPYSYSLNGGGSQSGNVFTGLTQGGHTATVQTAGCIVSIPATITEPAVLTASTSTTNVSCFGSNNGSAVVNPAGGTPGYTATWNTAPPQPTLNATGLSSGTYTATVTDNNGCATTASVIITEPAPLSVTINPSHVTCNGGANGSATATATGGTGPYTYTWNTSPVQNTPAATGLSAGTYTVTIGNTTCTANGIELITNGNFSSGNAGFTSSYAYCNSSGCLNPESTYGVGNDPTFLHPGFSGADHTTGTGQFMVVNGSSTANTNVWCQTVSVSPNTDYEFSTWVTSVSAGSPAMLQFSFNGTNVGSILNAPSTVGTWDQFFYSWNSGSLTSVDICIVNQNTVLGGNDFGLDDISFQQCSPTCSAIESVVITEPAPFTKASAITNVSCNGGTNGSATVSATGGTGSISYTWNTSPVQTGPTANGLSAGSYTVTFNDMNSCEDTLLLWLTEPAVLSATTTVIQNVSCSGTSDGSASVSISGGISPYTISWNTIPVQNGPTASNLGTGTYTATVIDSNNCSSSSSIVITEPVTVVADATLLNNVSCNGGSNGSATATANGGTQPYTYSWIGTGQITPTANNLSAGTYTIVIADQNGCMSADTVIISQPSILAASIASQNVLCYGDSTGSATATITGGMTPYTYSWSPNTSSLPSVSLLTAGTFTLTVTDANNCATAATTIITEPADLTLLNATSDVTCFGGCNGQIVVAPQGGTSPYTYSWTNGSNGPASVNLCAGSYCVTVTDNNGCVETFCDILIQPSEILIQSSSLTAHCDLPDGSAFASASGGTPGYSYSWNSGAQLNDTATALPPGQHIITVTDSYNCVQTDTVQVLNAPGVSLTAAGITQATCKDSCNGSASVAASGSSGPYQFTWNTTPPQNNDTALSLCAGIYSSIVTDVFGCRDTVEVTISEPAQVTITSADPSIICQGQSATIAATAAGGTGGYSFSWSPSTNLNSTTGSYVLANPLATSTYTISAVDQNGCIAIPEEVIVSVHPPLSLAATGDTSICYQKSTSLSSIASGGNGGPYSYSWTPSAELNSSTVPSPIATPTTTTTFTVSISDGCTVAMPFDPVVVSIFALPAVQFTPASAQGCYPLEVDFQNTTFNTYSSSWDFGDGSTSTQVSPDHSYSTPGSYSITLEVIDYNGCKNNTTIVNAVTVHDHPSAEFSWAPENATVLDPRVQFEDGSSPDVNAWSWDFANLDTLTVQNPLFTFPDSGNYNVKLTVTNEFGCFDTISNLIRINPDYAFYLPNAFSPNGDGINEVFIPVGIGVSPENYKFQIFDRWGSLIFESTDPERGWKGDVKGSSALEDVYIWKLALTTVNSDKLLKKQGTVTIVK